MGVTSSHPSSCTELGLVLQSPDAVCCHVEAVQIHVIGLSRSQRNGANHFSLKSSKENPAEKKDKEWQEPSMAFLQEHCWCTGRPGHTLEANIHRASDVSAATSDSESSSELRDIWAAFVDRLISRQRAGEAGCTVRSQALKLKLSSQF